MNVPRVALFVSVILGAGCGGPTSPSAPGTISTFTGVWQGQYRITECIGDRHCGVFIGVQRSFVLRLQQSGTSVTGVVVLVHNAVDNAYYQGDLTVNVAGEVAADGAVTVRGLKPALSPSDASGDVEVESFTLKPMGAAMTGTLAYVSRYLPIQNFETSLKRVAGIVVNVTRIATVPLDLATPFQGHWVGRALIRTCTADIALPCGLGAGSFTSFDLTLSQSGSDVSGMLERVPVMGSIFAQILTLQGSLPPQPESGGFGTVQVNDWSTTVDALGRMRGSYTWNAQFSPSAGVNAGKVFTTKVVYDLVSVVLVP